MSLISEKKQKSFYITTTLPYVNADLHIGHALEFVRADVFARYKKLIGYDVFFNTGTDEHGMKIYEKAKEKGKSPQEFVDEMFLRFKKQVISFGVSDTVNYIRTTENRHEKSAQSFWRKVRDNGFIYKKNYKAKYCIGCESEKTDSELADGFCPLHPNMKIEIIDEENYFFAFSKFQKPLSEFYSKNHDFVVPDFRFNEVKAFVDSGLEDFSISRLKTKMSWGIPVPDDENHVMYVWFDALINYISTLGWGTENDSNFDKYWINGNPVQYCGKDNTRFQAVMWQAMLIAGGIPNTSKIIVNGHITAEGGTKMSKSLGNVVNPLEIVEEYGTDALRFFLLKEISSFEDSPFAIDRFREIYNADLANGLGNLVSRVMKMASVNDIKFDERVANDFSKSEEALDFQKRQVEAFESFNLQKATSIVWELISKTNLIIQEKQPFKKIKTDKKTEAEDDIRELLVRLYFIGSMLVPILPKTSEEIVVCIKEGKVPEKPLFMRK